MVYLLHAYFGKDGREEAEELLEQLLRTVERMLFRDVVHGDLSSYNVLVWGGEVTVIDFPQAVDLVTNPHGFDLLHHDVTTMCTWFARQGVANDAEEVFASLLADAW